jgi:hypothetical protein
VTTWFCTVILNASVSPEQICMSKSVVRGFVIDVRLWALPFYVRSQKPALLRCKRFHFKTSCGSFHTCVDIRRGQSTSCLPSHQVTWLATYVVGVWQLYTKMVRDRWNFGCPMEIFMRDTGNGFLCRGNVSTNGVWYVNRREPDEIRQSRNWTTCDVLQSFEQAVAWFHASAAV